MQIWVILRQEDHYETEPAELRGAVVEVAGCDTDFEVALERAERMIPAGAKVQTINNSAFTYRKNGERRGTFVDVTLRVVPSELP